MNTENSSNNNNNSNSSNGNKEFSAKEAFKQSVKNLPRELFGELFTLSCLLISLIIIFFSQTQKQLENVFEIINDGNWVIISLMFIGVMLLTFIIEEILKIIFKIIKFLIRLIQGYR